VGPLSPESLVGDGESRFDPRRGSLDVWILLIARSLAIDLLRRQTQETRSLFFEPNPPEVSDEPGPEWYAEHRDFFQRTRKAMDRLPSGQRSAVELAYLGQRSSTQVAELQDIPLGTAKSRIRVGVATLRKALSEGDDAAKPLCRSLSSNLQAGRKGNDLVIVRQIMKVLSAAMQLSPPRGRRASEPLRGPYITEGVFAKAKLLDKGCSVRSQSVKGVGMRRAPIRMGITLLVATLVGSLAVPSMASDRSQGDGLHRVALTSLKAVKIINFAFKPKTITISKGTKVKWTNGGSVSHTTTSNKGLWDSGALAPGAAFGHVFRKAGTFKYHCTIHPTLMHGKIVVT